MPRALLTDEYTLTMSQFYWRKGMHEDTVAFEQFVRKLPNHRGYLIAAGLGTALWHLRQFRFEQEEIDFLRSQEKYDPGFLDYLRDMDFTCDVWAIPEGTPVCAQTPLIRIEGPRVQATVIESLLLSVMNHQTMVASKVARIVHAADGRAVLDFSLRRLHGPDAAIGVARAAYIAGAAGTATVEAGRLLKIPTSGTMAHAMVMAFGEDAEQDVFEQVMQEFPDSHALLIDTYDTLRGTERAVMAAYKTGIPLRAVRVDSNVAEDVAKVKAILEEAYDGRYYPANAVPTSSLEFRLKLAATSGDKLFGNTKIIASDDLDEYKIAALVDAGAPIDSFGVGTMLGTSADAPNLGGVYKLVEQDSETHRFVMKRTEGKQTDPGRHQVWREYAPEGIIDTLTLYDEQMPIPGAVPLMRQVMQSGRVTTPQPSLMQTREHYRQEMERLPQSALDLDAPQGWTLQRSPKLWQLRADLGDTEAVEMVGA